ncbi:MAG: leucine--tRNA ligase [Flavobacteriales bacterium]|nr:leucine--tRNA ligase [Flavobacteriales bacterium]
MDYNFIEIEKRWREYWKVNQTFKTNNDESKPKYYILDMFPYPSGQGLHVGHPLGYIASDIITRYKRLTGYNVLHPMGYDSFGLPAEQYAIETGQHPAITTKKNIETYRKQLDLIGFSFDWDREVRTSDPKFYKWTQWIFMKLFNSWYNKDADKAESIDTLVAKFELGGSEGIAASNNEHDSFSAEEWNAWGEKEQRNMLLNYRLAYLSATMVNWCPKLGTVLANEEVKDGVSERGEYPVERKLMKQWSLRITAYADRLLAGLDEINWTHALKEMQRNWIGRSEGASIHFHIDGFDDTLEVFTTRPDTIFGATFMVLAPEHEVVDVITPESHKTSVAEYVEVAKNRSERDRLTDVKTVSGVFTGAYAIHPFSGEKIPIWISDYVLAGYGTGAIMAVPSGDQRDWNFAKHFDIPIVSIVSDTDISEGANENKDGVMINSDFLNGMTISQAISEIIKRVEDDGVGTAKINYKFRDAIFSRQRYWGEPFPVYYKDETPYLIDESELPLELPEVDKYLPTEEGNPPLARAENWHTKEGHPYETNTMPGWAGSSWYYLRYMDALNEEAFVSDKAINYWQNVDLYLGGAEHATGHLLYVRFWTKFLFDLGHLPFDEPAKKLINQGMILGEGGEKMSKRKGNVINPDDLVMQYGADTLRMYEMFLGPLDQPKPWDTKGIEGVHKFLRKFWRLYHNEANEFSVSDQEAVEEELRPLSKVIKKVQDDIDNLSFNTSVSALMICVNELSALKCNKRSILSELVIVLSPFAPLICEEIWCKLGNDSSISFATYPSFDEQYLVSDSFEYPISFNGKTRFKLNLPVSWGRDEIEKEVLGNEQSVKWLDGKEPRKVIVVEKRIVNVVL